jgi:hypothetical protein
MKRSFFLLPGAFILLLSAGYSGYETRHYADDRYKVDCKMKDGMFDGLYLSWYTNGNKKAQGQFSANQRKGKWSVWDQTGKLILTRDYSNAYEFKETVVGQESKTVVPPVYSLKRNEADFYTYFNFDQKDVVVSKRTWRDVGADDASSFFHDDVFYHALVDSVMKGKIKLYDFKSDELTAAATDKQLQIVKDTVGYEIIGFKIKEDWFYDKLRKTAERRIVTICPVVCKKVQGDDDFSYEMGWFYFPALRNTLGAIKIMDGRYGPDIKNLDDLFFFHHFPSTIYKETNVKNLEIREYKTLGQVHDEQFRIEIDLVEQEHELWVK